MQAGESSGSLLVRGFGGSLGGRGRFVLARKVDEGEIALGSVREFALRGLTARGGDEFVEGEGLPVRVADQLVEGEVLARVVRRMPRL